MKLFSFLPVLATLLSIGNSEPKDSESDNELRKAERLIQQHIAELNGGTASGYLGNAVLTVQKLLNGTGIDCTKSVDTRYYRFDGACNNLLYPLWGAAFTVYRRELPHVYHDGKLVPRLYSEGSEELLPSARLVSTECLKSLVTEQNRDLAKKHNQLLMQFGQFFSHDLSSTPEMEGIDCCDEDKLDANGLHSDTNIGGPCLPIPIPADDRYFNTCMPFNRSVHEIDSHGVAQQMNIDTAFVDHSSVYGSDDEFIQSIRAFEKGKLRVDDLGMLPQDNTQKCLLFPPIHGCPVGGDNRVSVFPGLTSLHLVFHREHNRLADKLAEVHPDWTDEKLFQEARRLNIAQLQNFVYEEFVPAVIGRKAVKKFGLRDKSVRYDPTRDPTIINSFAAAAFRYGHSQINNHFHFGHGATPIPLRKLFFRPHIYMYEGVESYRKLIHSLLTHRGQDFDSKFAEGVTDFLFFGVDAPGASTDLLARNIHRGRDHALPPYLQYLDLALNFFGDTKYVNKLRLPTCIPGLYKSVGDVDLFLGGVYEDPLPRAVVGPTFGYLIGLQFKNLREGDRFFFDLKDSAAGFTKAQLKSIRKTTFAGIICRNSYQENIQKKIFLVPDTRRNPEVPCHQLPDLDFSLF